MKHKIVIVFLILLLIIIFLLPIKTKYEWFIDGELVSVESKSAYPQGDEYNICYCNILGISIYKTKHELHPLGKDRDY